MNKALAEADELPGRGSIVMCSEPPGCLIPFHSGSLGLPFTQPHFPVGVGQRAERTKFNEPRTAGCMSFRGAQSPMVTGFLNMRISFIHSISRGSLNDGMNTVRRKHFVLFCFPHLVREGQCGQLYELHFVAMMKYHTPEWLKRVYFGLSFQRNVSVLEERHGCKQQTRWQEPEVERSHLQMQADREWSGHTIEAFNAKGTPCNDTLPPARLDHLNFPQQYHQMGSNHSVAQNYGVFFIQTI